MLTKDFKIFIIGAFSLLLILASGLVFAQADLEVDYPVIGGETIFSTQTFITDYVKYIFNFAIILCGLVTLGVIVFAGTKYFGSRGNPAAHKDARDRIICGIIGLLILLSSYIILYTINPNLVIFSLQPLTSGPEAFVPVPPVEKPATQIRELPLGTLINSNTSLSATPYSNYEGILDPANFVKMRKTGDMVKKANERLAELMEDLRFESEKLKDYGMALRDQGVLLRDYANNCKCSQCSSGCDFVSNNECSNCTEACGAKPCTNCSGETCNDRSDMATLINHAINGIPGTITKINDQKIKAEAEIEKVELFAKVVETFLSSTITVETFEIANLAEINAVFLLDPITRDLISNAAGTGMKGIEQTYGNPQEIKEKLENDLMSLENIEMTIKQNPFSIMSYPALLEETTDFDILDYGIEPGDDPATFYYIP